jgi:hypothetical protein
VVVAFLASVSLALPAADDWNMCASSTISSNNKDKEVLGEVSVFETAVQNIFDKHLNYSCEECFKMMDALQQFCKVRSHSKPLIEEFQQHCRDHTIPYTFDYDLIGQKCAGFYDFITEIYCPLDPCVQVTQSFSKAPTALCDLMKCTRLDWIGRPVERSPNIPLMCPDYLKYIIGYCQKKNETQVLDHEICRLYPLRFEREACEVVVDRILEATLPMDFCTAAYCEGIPPTKYHEYCDKVLHLPPYKPVPESGYLAWLNGSTDCKLPEGFGINVQSATYGRNCSGNFTNNILPSLRSRCQGQLRCTFGNPDMAGKDSRWDPTFQNNNTECRREFEINYSCSPQGKVYTVIAGVAASFQAVPFDCLEDLKFKTRSQSDEMLAEMAQPQPRRIWPLVE